MGIRSRSVNKILSFPVKVSDAFEEVTKAAASMPDTVGSLPVYDDKGVLLGYIPLYENSDLSSG